MIAKKSDGSQAKEKESTDSSTTLEDDDVKGKSKPPKFSFQDDDKIILGRKKLIRFEKKKNFSFPAAT